MRAQFFDGLTARAHDVDVEHVADQLVIRKEGRQIAVWPLVDLRLIRAAAALKGPVLGSSSSPNQRLVFPDQQIISTLGALSVQLSLRDGSPEATKSRRRLFALGVAVVGLLAGLFIAVPWLAGPLATFVPASVSQTLGQQLTESLERSLGKRCIADDRAVEILSRLTNRLSAGVDSMPPIHISVLKSDLSNALTAPGGYIVVLKGLIKAAESSQELAGVIAHELAHAALRHPEESLLRQSGIGLLASAFSQSGALSDMAVGLAGLVMVTAYSRDDESAADEMALGLLRRANISADGLATFFARLDAKQGPVEKAFKYVSTHPPSGTRSEMIGAAGNGGGAAMSAADWRALKLICSGD